MTRMVKKYGNSGGVYLPSSWVGGRVEVKLLSRPARPGIDLPMALGESMRHVVSMLVYGSWARGEQEEGSDIDVLVVTDGHLKGLKMPAGLEWMCYDVTTMSAAEAKNAAGKDALFRKSLEDAKAVFNDSFLEELKSVKVGKVPAGRIALARSSLGIIKSSLAAGAAEGLAYPIMMRLKEMLLVKCVRENRRYSLGMLEAAMLKAGLSGNEYRAILQDYRDERAGKGPRGRAGKAALEKAAKLLEKLVTDAGKKEKGAKGN
jgi:predicted nucleotidyltransferase